MTQTIRHRLPLLAAGQAQKEITHNEALLTIDRRLHPVVETRRRMVPPEVAAEGEAYIVPIGATGAWAGAVNAIASFDGYGWDLAVPPRGTLAWVADEEGFSVFDGQWSSGGWPVSALRIDGRIVLGADPVSIPEPVGGTMIDIELRATIALLTMALRAQGLIL